MQIESLRYFVELARAGSFYGAAKRAFISQQGLNKAIRSLESELGIKLVERSRRGIQLTKEGEVFLDHAQRILAEYNALLDDLMVTEHYYHPQTKRLVVNVTYYAAQILAALSQQQSNLLATCTIVEKPFHKLLKEAASSDGNFPSSRRWRHTRRSATSRA